MKLVRLLFTPTNRFAAEFSIFQGACLNIYHPSNHEIEALIDDWHQNGVPMRYDSQDEACDISGIERIAFCDPRFETALISWAADHGYHAIVIPEHALPAWELALRAPLEDEDLQRIARMVGTSSHSRLERITDSLKRAVVELETGK
jgi:hypothetical protein